jgi:hypothetical protein
LIQNAWTAIKAIIAQGEKDVMKLCSDIAKAFENMDDTVSLLDVVKIVLVDAAVIFLDILKGIVALVLGVLRDVIRWIVANGNKPVEIPIFSSLYRDISGGHALTMFDAVCLVVAIPATVINKVLTGKALPNISNFIDKTSFAAYMNGNLEAKKSLQVSQFSAGAFIGSDAICTLMQVIDVVADGKVNAMAMSERSLLQPELSEMHPQVRAMALKVPDFTKWKCISWVNLVSSGVNVVSGCPARQSYTDTKQHGVDWVVSYDYRCDPHSNADFVNYRDGSYQSGAGLQVQQAALQMSKPTWHSRATRRRSLTSSNPSRKSSRC